VIAAYDDGDQPKQVVVCPKIVQPPITVIIAGSERLHASYLLASYLLASYLLAASLYKIDDDIRLGPLRPAHRSHGNAEPGAVRHGGVMPRA